MKGYKALFIGVFSLLIIFSFILTGCSEKPQMGENKEKITVYTSLFPLYDFAKQIGGEYVEVKSILPAGAEAHDFEPSIKDMVEFNNARILIYNGAGFENWINKAKENLDSDVTLIVDASEGIDLTRKASQDEDAHEEENGDEHAHEEEHDHGDFDPHIWLDPMLAKQQALNIQKALIKVDPLHEEEYKKNYESLAQQLDDIDKGFKDVVAKAQKKQFVTSHKSFSYFADRYGLEQISVTGLSPSVEPGQKELQRIIEVVKKNNLRYVAFGDLVESKVAETVLRETGAEAVRLHTLENVTKEELKANKSYIDLMRENLEVMKKVLEAR